MGTGNVARHLFDVFSEHDHIQVVEVSGRNKESLDYFAKFTKTNSQNKFVENADIYILALSDDALFSVAGSLRNINGLLIHTSGAISIEVLPKNVGRGVFYPLQSFTKNRKVDFTQVPICIEAENKRDFELLHILGSIISNQVFEVNSSQRSALHLAAVFVNNFTNHMFHIGQQICGDTKLPFSILQALINETVHKIDSMSPFDAQTGPARRGDSHTISSHLDLLKNTDYKSIYLELTESIQKTYGEKL